MNLSKVRLIINADDFGLTKSITDVIINAFVNGVLTSTSVLVNADFSDYALSCVKKYPNLSVGLHFQLVDGKPVTSDLSKISTLIDKDGLFYKNFKIFFKKFYLGQINLNHIKIEFLNQLKKMLAYGIKPSHIDTHQHLHLNLKILSVIANVLNETKITTKIRNPIEIINYSLHKNINFSVNNIIKVLYLNPFFKKYYNDKLKKFNLKSPDYFFGQYFSGNMNEENLIKTLEYLNKLNLKTNNIITCEIMMHPGSYDEFKNISNCDETFAKYQWNDEFNALISLKVKEKILDYNFKLISYNEL